MHGLQTGIQFTVRCKMVSAFDTFESFGTYFFPFMVFDLLSK